MTDDPVAAQYEAYPYPHRDPKDERTRLVTGSPSQLDELAHYLFRGRLDVRGFRALVAGGGTGDATIMLAQQLADAGGGEVVYLDLSRRARQIAEARAAERGLANIAFHTGSLQDLPELGLGAFDYIDCCGVLHHLDDPPAGLRALRAVLKDGGGMGLMVYAPYGRTGLYPMQEMLRTLGGGQPLEQRVQQARQLWNTLPATNWLRRNPYLGDHKRSDAELVDLFLHARDRPYTVDQLADLLAAAEMQPTALLEPARYEPASYLNAPALLTPLRDLDWLQRAGFAERLAGNLKKHVLYAAPRARGDTVAAFDRDAVPRLLGVDGPTMARQLGGGAQQLTADFDGVKVRFPLPRLAGPILQRIDGTRTLGAILDEVRHADPGLDAATAERQVGELVRAFNGLNKLVLRR